MAVKHILSNIKVLDFTHAVAGPTSTRLMAEMGADIINPNPQIECRQCPKGL